MFRYYQKNEIDTVVFEIKNNKACVFPTDTVIGIGALDETLLYKIKQRPKHKKIVLLVANSSALGILNDRQKQFLNHFWPGGVTVIHNGVSYRMPNDDWLLLLLSKTGPLYCSSANLSNQAVIENTLAANEVFDEKWHFHLVVVEGTKKTDLPSTIIDIDEWKIIRSGCMIDEIKTYLDQEGISYGIN